MSDRIVYLSERWLSEADRAVADLAPLEEPLVVAMAVNGGPVGRCRYRLILGPDTVGFIPEQQPEPAEADVSMTMDWSVAIGVAQGDLSAQRAFLDGDIVLGGDITRLLGHQEALAAVDDRLADLRSRTDFAPG